jgi:hypothetical protein
MIDAGIPTTVATNLVAVPATHGEENSESITEYLAWKDTPAAAALTSNNNNNNNNNNNEDADHPRPWNDEDISDHSNNDADDDHRFDDPMFPQLIISSLTKKNQKQPKKASSFWKSLAFHQRLKRNAVMRHVSNAERTQVVAFLAWELDKVAMFYLAQWQRLSQQLVDYNSQLAEQQQQQLGVGTISTTHQDTARLTQLGQEILELEAFCITNLLTVRQLLIRYDAFARSFEGTPMLHYYMKTIQTTPQTSFRKIYQHEELHAVAESFLDLCRNHLELSIKFQNQRTEFQQVLESSESAEATSSAGHIGVQDTLLQTLRHYFLLGSIEDRLGFEPAYLTSRGKSLTSEMRTMAEWRHRQDHHLKPQSSKKGDDTEERMSRTQLYNLILTLLAAFLYCMNYYIVEPSSTMYVNALGAHDAMSGTLIGMMPIASFLSAIVYSFWTNYSFRHPFLLSCLLLLSGNLLYSAAYNFKSIEIALAGRFLTGLGGPKCIVRRYMADTTSLNMRTSVNAGFGMVVAAGSALGPGCAILLNRLNFACNRLRHHLHQSTSQFDRFLL